MATLDEAEDVAFCDTAVLACTRYRVNIDSFLLGEMSNSWSRQGFTTRWSISSLLLITWRCCCSLVFDLVLCGHNVLGWLRGLHRRGRFCGIDFHAATSANLINLEHDMTNGDNLIVTKVDLSNLARGSRGDFSNKFVRENFAQILVLQQ